MFKLTIIMSYLASNVGGSDKLEDLTSHGDGYATTYYSRVDDRSDRETKVEKGVMTKREVICCHPTAQTSVGSAANLPEHKGTSRPLLAMQCTQHGPPYTPIGGKTIANVALDVRRQNF